MAQRLQEEVQLLYYKTLRCRKNSPFPITKEMQSHDLKFGKYGSEERRKKLPTILLPPNSYYLKFGYISFLSFFQAYFSYGCDHRVFKIQNSIFAFI